MNLGVVYHPVEGVIRVVASSQLSASNHGPAQLAGTAAPFLAQQSAPGLTAPLRKKGTAQQPPQRLSGARVLPYFKSLGSITYFYKLWDEGDVLTGRVGVRHLPLTGRKGESQRYYDWRKAAEAINIRAETGEVSCTVAAAEAEAERLRLGKGVSTFLKDLVKEAVKNK
jgi:hypothetical protein